MSHKKSTLVLSLVATMVVVSGCGSKAPEATANPVVPVQQQMMLRDILSADVNGDGVADLLFGGSGADYNNRTNSGSVFIRFGSAVNPSGVIDLNPANFDIRIDGASSGGEFGIGTALAAGDLNGDGVKDIILGDPLAGAGTVYVIYGGAGLVSGVRDLADPSKFDARLDGAVAGDQAGSFVAAGDINGDGYDDLIVGAPLADPLGRADAGRVYVKYGGPGFATGIAGLSTSNSTYAGGAADDMLGTVLVADLNGDGQADLIMGAFNASPAGRLGAGQVHILFGGEALTEGGVDLAQPTNTDVLVIGAQPGDAWGGVLSAGDINDDTQNDLLLGAPQADFMGRIDAGCVAAIFGGPWIVQGTIDLATDSDMLVGGAAAGDSLGASIHVATFASDPTEVLIGAPGTDFNGRDQSGSVYVIAPHAGILDAGTALDFTARYDGSQAGTSLGLAVGMAADYLYMSAPYSNPTGDCGVIFGVAAGETGTVDMAALTASTVVFMATN